MALIETAKIEDVAAIRDLAEVVFDGYGEFGKTLQKFIQAQGVTTLVARLHREVAGFCMLGFLPWSAGQSENLWIADLLALAVAPKKQRQGIGRELMVRAFDIVRDMHEWREIYEVQLTCAEDNIPGLDFFYGLGFEVSNRRYGSYAGGQPAYRLAKKWP